MQALEAPPKAVLGYQQKTQSVLKRISATFVLLYVVSLLLLAFAMYEFTKRQVYAEAQNTLAMHTNIVSSIRTFIKEENTQQLIKSGVWHSGAISPIVAAKGVATRYKSVNPSTRIRFVSDNPLNLEDLPNPLEKDIIDTYRTEQQNNIRLTPKNLEGRVAGQNYLVYATPEVVTKPCLACHDTAKSAPPTIATKYPGPMGYSWRVGDVVGATVIGVPLGDIESITVNRTLIATGILTVVFLAIWLALFRFIQISMVMPLKSIAQALSNMSLNRPANFPERKVKDEIWLIIEAGKRIKRGIESLRR
jgi:hypothetical protein